MSAILKFGYHKRKHLRFSKVHYLNYTKKAQFCMWQLHFPKTRGNKNKQWTHSTPVKLWFVIMMCGPNLNRALTHFRKKGTHVFMLLSDFFWLLLKLYTNFCKFSPWFFSWFSTNLTQCQDLGGGGKMGRIQIFLVKSTHLGGISLYI